MVVLELYFKQFHSKGSGNYLDRWAAEVDTMTAAGWIVLDCLREWQHPGYWTVILARPEDGFSRQRAPHDLREDWGA